MEFQDSDEFYDSEQAAEMAKAYRSLAQFAASQIQEEHKNAQIKQNKAQTIQQNIESAAHRDNDYHWAESYIKSNMTETACELLQEAVCLQKQLYTNYMTLQRMPKPIRTKKLRNLSCDAEVEHNLTVTRNLLHYLGGIESDQQAAAVSLGLPLAFPGVALLSKRCLSLEIKLSGTLLKVLLLITDHAIGTKVYALLLANTKRIQNLIS